MTIPQEQLTPRGSKRASGASRIEEEGFPPPLLRPGGSEPQPVIAFAAFPFSRHAL
jgi:hypothetical protein